MDETKNHIIDFKTFFRQHLRLKPESVTMDDWSWMFFSTRQDHLLQTYKSGSKFSDCIMNDIHLFIRQVQKSYKSIWGIMLGIICLDVLNEFFFSQWFQDQPNPDHTFLYQTAPLSLYFHHEKFVSDIDEFLINCNVLTEAAIDEYR